MLRRLATLLLVIGVVTTGYALLALEKSDTPPPQPASPVITEIRKPVIENTKLRASDVLLLSDARRLIGPNAEQANTPEPSSGGLVNGMQLSLIAFQAKDGLSVKNFAIALQTSMDEQAYRAYQAARPAVRQDISSYGEQAFWTADNKQLHIYKDGNWLKISVFNSEADALTFAKLVADIVVPRL